MNHIDRGSLLPLPLVDIRETLNNLWKISATITVRSVQLPGDAYSTWGAVHVAFLVY